MKKFQVLTTMNYNGWHQYGERMVESFVKWWPEDIELHLYAENFVPNKSYKNLVVYDIFDTCSNLKNFVLEHDNEYNRGIRNGTRDFKFDAIKFCYKVFSQVHRIKNSNAQRLLFIDADTITFDTPPMKQLSDMLGPQQLCAYLGREKSKKLPFSETGFIMYNLEIPATKEFAQVFETIYTSGEVFKLDYQVDCYPFDVSRKRIEQKYNITSNNLNDGFGNKHPFINTILGTFMDHLKGDQRKQNGKSAQSDFKERVLHERTHSYWK